MGSVSNLYRVYWDSVGSLSNEFDHLQLSLVEVLVGLAESDGGAVIVLKVEVDSERVLVDDLVIDESLDEVGVGISGQGWEGQTDQSLWFFEGFGSLIGYKYLFIELVLTKANGQFLEVCHQRSIKVRNHILRILHQTHVARVFLDRGAFRVLSFDKDIAGTSVDVEIVLHPCDGQRQSEEVAHRDDAVGFFGGTEVQFMPKVMAVHVPHVVVDNVTCLMTLLESLLKLFWVRVVKWQSYIGLYSQAQQSCKDEQHHRASFCSHELPLTVEKYKNSSKTAILNYNRKILFY